MTRVTGVLRRLVPVMLAIMMLAEPARAHHGLPVAIARQRLAGPYDIALWANPDVGMGVLYVVLVPQNGVPFAPPQHVQITVRPASGAGQEQRYDATPEAVRHGARFVAMVDLDSADTWQVSVVVNGASGQGEMRASFESIAPSSPGVPGMMLYAAPFFLVAGVWGKGKLVRRQHRTLRSASISSP